MRILAIGAHLDDIESGCGGTLHRMIGSGHEVTYLGFSTCGNDALLKECQLATAVLGPMDLQIHDLPVRRFDEHRQTILDRMIVLRDKFNPDIVFTHGSYDQHQDHHVVYEESCRAFKKHSVFGYNFAWNCITYNSHLTVRIDIEKKMEALDKYESQKWRENSDPNYMRALNFKGEQFEVIRLNEKLLCAGL
jgi:LmbE family N-acetylglucosaminyl deacetylase